MTRIAIALAAGLLIVGCTQEQAPSKPNPTPPKIEATHKHDATAKVDAPKPAPKAPKLYFEVLKDGKTYVTDKPSTATSINQGNLPANATPATGPNGEAILVATESPDAAPGLTAEYAKQHPKK